MPRGKQKPETFGRVILEYLLSPEFQGLAANTKDGYRRVLEVAVMSRLGEVPVAQARTVLVQAFLNHYADRPAQQKKAQVALKSVSAWAMRQDFLDRDVTAQTVAPGGTGGHKPWTDYQVQLAERYARPDLARVITLAVNTGQRGSDLVRMMWDNVEWYQGVPGINITTKKTARTLWVVLPEHIMGWPRTSVYLLTKIDGRPFKQGEHTELSDMWLKERARNAALAPLAELTLHGLRSTAIERMRLRNLEPTLIADTIGMSVQMVERYCRMGNQKDKAIAAHRAMETNRENVFPFQSPKAPRK